MSLTTGPRYEAVSSEAVARALHERMCVGSWDSASDEHRLRDHMVADDTILTFPEYRP